MKQTRLETVIEAMVDTLTGLVVAWLFMTYVIAPLFGLPTSSTDDFIIVILFTVLSIGRKYLWRRFFNAELHKVVHKTVVTYCKRGGGGSG